MLRRRLPFIGTALVGAAAVVVVWVFTGGGGGGPAAALAQDPGIAPPDYVYLDNARVVLYLGQIEGGLSASERQTAEVTQSRNAGAAAGGFQFGGSAGSSASVERTVTPTATARFYRLLDRLHVHGYLRTIDAAAPAASLARAFGTIPEGTFVQLRNCTLRLPTYVQLEQLLRTSHGRIAAFDAYEQANMGMPPLAQDAASIAKLVAGRSKTAVGSASVQAAPRVRRRLAVAARRLVNAAGADPRVPLSTCSGQPALRPRGVDLLVPIRLGELSPEQSLLAGPVTVVGKVVRAVRHGDIYVDDASLALFNDAVSAVDAAAGSGSALSSELDADVTVLSPGVVILPIAIYK